MTLHGTKNKEETYGLIAKAWVDASVGSVIEIIQPNDLGGKSLEKTLLSHFPNATSESKKKARYITLTKTENAPDILPEWLAHTKLRLVEDTGFYSMPGLFGWNKIDVGSQILLDHISGLKGIGADFGCGYGFLSKSILETYPDIKTLYAFDNDSRAVEACQYNIADERIIARAGNCTKPIPDLPNCDFIVMNPPFHDGEREDKNLGHAFIEVAHHHLKKCGVLWMVANAHLPYEKTLCQKFSQIECLFEGQGFKIFRAVK